MKKILFIIQLFSVNIMGMDPFDAHSQPFKSTTAKRRTSAQTPKFILRRTQTSPLLDENEEIPFKRHKPKEQQKTDFSMDISEETTNTNATQDIKSTQMHRSDSGFSSARVSKPPTTPVSSFFPASVHMTSPPSALKPIPTISPIKERTIETEQEDPELSEIFGNMTLESSPTGPINGRSLSAPISRESQSPLLIATSLEL